MPRYYSVLSVIMILILGAGWTGTKICLRDPSRFVATTRNSEKLSKLTSKGLNAITFDLLKEDTWSNLPPKTSVDATIFTFEILESHLPYLQLLWEKHIATDKPVICLGSTSVFYNRPGDLRTLIDETAPLTGLGVWGKSLTDRVKGEEWILSKGATVLHLSGIASDDAEEERYPLPSFDGSGSLARRTVKSFLESGYLKNGLQLINLIHINDIYKICLLMIEKIASTSEVDTAAATTPHPIKGQRIITSCGTFRANELSHQGFNFDPLPEILPPHDTLNKSKTLSITKLVSLLPKDYEWTLFAGVKPVSQGLLIADGIGSDKRWSLMTETFEGKWQGRSVWYKRDKGEKKGGKLDHQAYIAEITAPTLPDPVLVGEPEYHLYCLDADTLIWHGKGLAIAKDGEMKITVTRKTFNTSTSRHSFVFPGMGGQITSCLSNVNQVGLEANFFHERSRSMIITMYARDAVSNKLLLESICITSFRCALGCNFPLKPLQSEKRGNVKDLILTLQGKKCHRQWMSLPLKETSNEEVCEYPTTVTNFFFDPDRVVQLFDDDLVCSLPPDIKSGEECALVTGCFHTAGYAQIVMLTFDSNGKLQKQILEKWS